MLAELAIRNVALIDELNLSFGPGFNVLTGETGAGKSILVGAIGLILGGRSSADLIRQGADEAEVSALFVPDAPDEWVRRLDEMGLPAGDEVLIRRVLAKSGRNRVFVNGGLTTLAQLALLGPELMALSGQHEHQRLLDPDRQLLFLDQFAGLADDRTAMAEAFGRWKDLERGLAEIEARIRNVKDKADLLEFQVKEIQDAQPFPSEDEDLEKERKLLKNAEKIYSLVQGAYEGLYQGSGSVVEVLDQVRSGVGKAAGLDDRLSDSSTQIEDAYHQLADAAESLRTHLDKITFDSERLAVVEDRLALLGRLKRKYGGTLEAVLAHAGAASDHLERLADMEAQRISRQAERDQARSRALEQAARLSRLRREAAEAMARAVTTELRTLGMPRLEFELAFGESPDGDAIGPGGRDQVEFLISPNVGEDLRPLARIASGGELSRAMLGLKSLLAGQDRVETVVFDEVDTGIGGAVAEVVGRKLAGLARHHQLICITHLPQIAVFGRRHFRVFKEVRGERTVTDIIPLAEPDRVEEISRMLGGLEPTESTRAAAREMLEWGNVGNAGNPGETL